MLLGFPINNDRVISF